MMPKWIELLVACSKETLRAAEGGDLAAALVAPIVTGVWALLTRGEASYLKLRHMADTAALAVDVPVASSSTVVH